MAFPLEQNGNPDKHNEMLVRTSPKKIPTADMLTPGPQNTPNTGRGICCGTFEVVGTVQY